MALIFMYRMQMEDQRLSVMEGQPMESKYVVLDWQQELYYEYLVFRKKSHGCAPSTEKT